MGKNYVESSLKRFLKRKVKITLGLVVAFMITGAVGYANPIIADGGEPINKNDTSFEMNISSDYYEQWKENNVLKTQNYAILAANKGIVNINSENIKIETKNVTEFHPETSISYSYGIQAVGNGIINLGNSSTQQIDITTTSDYFGIGVYADKLNGTGGKINIIANTVNISANGIGKDGDAYGIYCITRTTDSKEQDKSNIEIKAKNTNITVNTEGGKSIGIAAWSEGKVKINEGNVSIIAKDAIHTRGNSLVEINANNNPENIVKLNGNIKFEYFYSTSQPSSNTTVDSNVNIKLSNKDSIFTGKIFTDIISDNENKPENKDYLKYNGMKLGLSNGATWNVTGDSLVNDLTLDGGVINIIQTEETGNTTEHEKGGDVGDYTGLDDSKTVLNVDNLSGEGTVTFESRIEGEEVKVAEGNLRIRESTAKGTNLKVGLSGVNTDDLAENNISAEKALEELTDKVVNKDNQRPTDIKQTLFVNRGALTGEVTAELDKNGNIVNVKQEKETPITASVRDLAVINYLSWKQEMGSLTQRMGELRDSSAEHGVWARVYGGKVENGSQYDNKYQTYQVGYDKKYSVDNGRVYLGYLVSYTDGETDYALGHGENYSVGAGIYATWMNNNGHYADVLYKVSRLNNKFSVNDVEKLEGEYDTFGISLSTEYGKRFDIGEKWFIEPNIGMHLGRLGEETYKTDSGIEVSQDSIYTAEGRVGTAIGYKFSEKGNVYVRTHIVKEFAGDIDTEFERNGVHAKVSEDMGDTWLEFGVGASYRFTENMNVYADIEKTGDSTVDTKWQANLGFRYEF